MDRRPLGMVAPRSDRGLRTVDEGATLYDYDLRPPFLYLAQAQSAFGEPGKFVRRDTEEMMETIDVVPLMVQPIRTKWPVGPFSRDRTPECWSYDGVRGSSIPLGGVDALYGGRACGECEMRTDQPWEQPSQEGWCVPGYMVLLMGADDFGLLVLRLMGTSARLGRVFAAKGNLRSSVLRLSSKAVDSGRGRYFAIQAHPLRRLDADERSIVEANFEEYRGETLRHEEPEEATPPQQGKREAKPAPESPRYSAPPISRNRRGVSSKPKASPPERSIQRDTTGIPQDEQEEVLEELAMREEELPF